MAEDLTKKDMKSILYNKGKLVNRRHEIQAV
jgi:hypothetical protein